MYKQFAIIFSFNILQRINSYPPIFASSSPLTMPSFCLLQQVNAILINDHLAKLERDREGGERQGWNMTFLTMHERRSPRGEEAHSGVIPAGYSAPYKLLGKFPAGIIPCRSETPPNCYRTRNLFRDNKRNAMQDWEGEEGGYGRRRSREEGDVRKRHCGLFGQIWSRK